MIGRPVFRPAPGWRALAVATVVLLGLATVVGSGGGGIGIGLPSDCPAGMDCGPPESIPAVDLRPAHLTVQVGESATFDTVLRNVYGFPVYRWSRSSDGGFAFTDIAGATGPAYTLAGATLADDGAVFQVRVDTATSHVFAVAHLAVSAVPAVVFQDSEFAAADWEVVVQGSEQVDEPVATGGNPGAFGRMSAQFTLAAGASQSFHFARAAVYDPAVQGAVHVIDFAEDGVLLEGAEGASVVAYPALEQAGRRYRGGNRVAFEPSLTGQWRRDSRYASLVARDFVLLEGPPCAGTEACPDFAAGAATLRFGFLRIASAWADGPVVHGIDNWRVAVWPR